MYEQIENILEPVLERRERNGGCGGHTDHCGIDRPCDYLQKTTDKDCKRYLLENIISEQQYLK